MKPQRDNFTIKDVMKARGSCKKQAVHQLLRRRGIKLTRKIGNVWILTEAQFRILTEDMQVSTPSQLPSK